MTSSARIERIAEAEATAATEAQSLAECSMLRELEIAQKRALRAFAVIDRAAAKAEKAAHLAEFKAQMDYINSPEYQAARLAAEERKAQRDAKARIAEELSHQLQDRRREQLANNPAWLRLVASVDPRMTLASRDTQTRLSRPTPGGGEHYEGYLRYIGPAITDDRELTPIVPIPQLRAIEF